jgi:hypothetical protein
VGVVVVGVGVGLVVVGAVVVGEPGSVVVPPEVVGAGWVVVPPEPLPLLFA